MIISFDQFDGQYTQEDVDFMNEKLKEVLAFYKVADSNLTRAERNQLIHDVALNVTSNYDENIGCGDIETLMPDEWKRVIAASTNLRDGN
jgi:hypothetical protein